MTGGRTAPGARAALALLRDAAHTSWVLFKITVPISIATRLLQQAGAVDALGTLLAPLMRLVGLPPSMGLVWATAMATNLYGGMASFATLAPAEHLTTAQVTVACLLMLVAHALPVELRIVQKAGVRLPAMAAIRAGGGLLMAAALHQVYRAGGWLQEPAVMLLPARGQDASWAAWAAGMARSLGLIFAVVLALLAGMRVLDRLGITRAMTRCLAPLLRGLGMTAKAAPLAVIGITMGLSYGGGLILRECRLGQMGGRDVFYALTLMGLAHALIEDTFLMLALGGHVSGLFWARLGFAMLLTAGLVRLAAALPERAFARWLYRPPPAGPAGR